MDESVQLLVNEVLETFELEIEEKIESFGHRLSLIRTGRANKAVLDGVLVEYYGAKTPLTQISGISAPDGTTLMIKPFDRSSIDSIMKAIFESNIGITPTSNGESIIMNFPPLTKEKRIELSKDVKKLYNQWKDELNHHGRGSAKKALLAIPNLPEDDSKKIMEKIDELNRKGAERLKKVADEKEEEVTTL